MQQEISFDEILNERIGFGQSQLKVQITKFFKFHFNTKISYKYKKIYLKETNYLKLLNKKKINF